MARDTASGEKTIPFPSFVSPGLITTFRPVKSLNVACSSSPSSPPALNSFCLFPSTFSFFPSPFFPLLFFDVATILFRESRLTMIKRISEKDDKRTVYRRKTEQFLPEASEEMWNIKRNVKLRLYIFLRICFASFVSYHEITSEKLSSFYKKKLKIRLTILSQKPARKIEETIPFKSLFDLSR